MKLLWTELENYFKSQEKIKDIVSQKTAKLSQNILQLALSHENIEFHEVLWSLLMNTFKIGEELCNLIVEQDIKGSNFLHSLLCVDSSEIPEFILNKIEGNFNE